MYLYMTQACCPWLWFLGKEQLLPYCLTFSGAFPNPTIVMLPLICILNVFFDDKACNDIT